MGFLDKILGGSVGEVIKSVGDTVDKFVTTDAERENLKIELTKVINAHEEKQQELVNDELQSVLSDKQSARDMYKANSSLQKIFAISFLLCYVGLAATILMVCTKSMQLADYAIALISTIFGSMSNKVGTITDFLFGSSMGSKEKDMTNVLNTTKPK